MFFSQDDGPSLSCHVNEQRWAHHAHTSSPLLPPLSLSNSILAPEVMLTPLKISMKIKVYLWALLLTVETDPKMCRRNIKLAWRRALHRRNRKRSIEFGCRTGCSIKHCVKHSQSAFEMTCIELSKKEQRRVQCPEACTDACQSMDDDQEDMRRWMARTNWILQKWVEWWKGSKWKTDLWLSSLFAFYSCSFTSSGS